MNLHRQLAYLVGGVLAVLALIILTSLDGSPILVESTQIYMIRTHSKECGPGAGAVLRIGSVALCVKETQEQVKEKINAR
jgi:hypothetical protein